MWLTIGAFSCGVLAGVAARYGRLCTMTAVEDFVLGHDSRALKSWGLALAVAIAITAILAATGRVDLATSVYTTGKLDLPAALLGGILFGLGMALVGTCSFGVIVRAGSGDLRAAIAAIIIGVAAFAATLGILSPIRTALSGWWSFEPVDRSGALLTGLVANQFGTVIATIVAPLAVLLLLMPVVRDPQLRRRPRQLTAAVMLGAAVGSGWWVTAYAVDQLETSRLESLSFVAPAGRALLMTMGEGLADAQFGIASAAGVLAGAFGTAALKDELRWEAYDDAREMRRHIAGAVLMGLGGVLARGCSIGQGMSAASALAISAPFVIVGILLGARLGLYFLMDGMHRLRDLIRR